MLIMIFFKLFAIQILHISQTKPTQFHSFTIIHGLSVTSSISAQLNLPRCTYHIKAMLNFMCVIQLDPEHVIGGDHSTSFEVNMIRKF